MPNYSNSGIKLITTGDEANTWGDSTNINLELIDNFVNGYADITVTSTSVNVDVSNILTATFSQGQNKILRFTDSPTQAATVNIRITKNSSTGSPYFEGWFFVRNNLVSQNIVIYQGFSVGAGSYVTIANGKDAIIYCDGGGNVGFVNNNPIITSLSVTGNAIISGNFDVSGNTTLGNNTSSDVTLVNGTFNTLTSSSSYGTFQSTYSSGGGYIEYYKNAATSNGETIFGIRAYANDSTSVQTEYGRISVVAADVTNGTEDGSIYFYTIKNGAVTARSYISYSYGFRAIAATTDTSTYSLFSTDSAGVTTFYVRADGTISTGDKAASPTNNTTGSFANLYVSGSGLLQRSVSSIRYKNSIEDANYGLSEVMQLRPVTYKGNNDGDKIFGGFIAEEVDAVDKLQPFVVYNSDNQPDALAYGQMVSLLTKAIQEQQTMIEDLKARVAALGG